VQVEVAQQADLGQVVDQLGVDVQHQIGHGRLGEGLLRADRDPEPGLAEAAHPGQPDVELGRELVERGGRDNRGRAGQSGRSIGRGIA